MKIFNNLVASGAALGIILSAFIALPAQAAVHPAGTNVKTWDHTVWMITTDGCRKAYTSPGAFLSYGFNSFDKVVDATNEDFALPICADKFIPPQDGQVIISDRGADINTAYFITGGTKHGFTSRSVYDGLGFPTKRLTGSSAVRADISWMSKGPNIEDSTSQHLSGTLVNQDGTIYLVVDGGKLGIPDISIFNSWKYDFKNAVAANAADRALSVIGTISPKQPEQLNPTDSSKPSLIVSDSFVSFNYKKGGSTPQPYAAHVSNSSSKQAISFTVSVPNKPSWLNTAYATTPISLEPLNTSGVGVSVDPTGLAAGTYTTKVIFTGDFANSPASISVTLAVTNADTSALQITSDSTLPTATAGQAYTYQLQASGGVAPYSWSPVSTTYPSGCCILGVTTTGIFNTQSASTVSQDNVGLYSWVLQVTDSAGNKATKTFSLNIIKPAVNAYFQISTSNLAPGTVGQYYTANINFQYFTDGTRYASNATFSGLPPGVTTGSASSPNTTFGIVQNNPGYVTISGTPTTPGTYNVSLSLTDQQGATLSKQFTLSVNPQSSDTSGLPDFKVYGIGQVTPKLPNETNAIEVGKEATVTFYLTNGGSVATTNPQITLVYPTGVIPDYAYVTNNCNQTDSYYTALKDAVGGLACTYIVRFKYSQTTTVSNYGSIEVVIDQANQITEKDETNNWGLVNFDVKNAQ